jgi:DNA polymerase-3 subunit gamma/tau
MLLKAWDKFASSIEKSKPRVFSTLKTSRPVVQADGSVRVLVNSEAQRDHFLKNIKPGLSGFIKKATGIEKLEISAEVLEFEQNGKKIYTDQDKLDYLMKKNPDLGILKSRFGLDFDD